MKLIFTNPMMIKLIVRLVGRRDNPFCQEFFLVKVQAITGFVYV